MCSSRADIGSANCNAAIQSLRFIIVANAQRPAIYSLYPAPSILPGWRCGRRSVLARWCSPHSRSASPPARLSSLSIHHRLPLASPRSPLILSRLGLTTLGLPQVPMGYGARTRITPRFLRRPPSLPPFAAALQDSRPLPAAPLSKPGFRACLATVRLDGLERSVTTSPAASPRPLLLNIDSSSPQEHPRTPFMAAHLPACAIHAA